MDYKKIYKNLINSRKNRIQKQNEYYERHHILPKSLGGKDNKENLIKLTAREHFIAHWLLYKSAKNSNEKIKMANAWQRMCKNTKGLIVTAKQYERARKAFSKMISLSLKGKGNPSAKRDNCYIISPKKEIEFCEYICEYIEKNNLKNYLSSKRLRAVLNKKAKHHKNYLVFKTLEEVNNVLDKFNKMENYIYHEEKIYKKYICEGKFFGSKNSRAIKDNCYIVDVDGKIHFVEFLVDYCLANNLNTRLLRNVLRFENKKHHKGLQVFKSFEEAKNAKKLKLKDDCYIITPFNDKIYVEYIKDFVNKYPELNLSIRRLRDVLKGKHSNHKGFYVIKNEKED